MNTCILCFSFLSDFESLQIDQCSHMGETGPDIVRQHFSFAEKILSPHTPISIFICEACWNHLRTFHEFFLQVTTNYLNCTDVEGKIEIKEEYIIDEDNPEQSMAGWDEGGGYVLEEVKIEDESQASLVGESSGKKPRGRRRNVKNEDDKRERKPKQMNAPVDPMDDEKMRKFADMSCDHCTEVFSTMADAMGHYRSVHRTNGYLKCCEKRFKKRCRLLDHVNSVHLNYTFTCEFCGKSFGSEIYLKRHKMQHEEVKDYECDHCGKTFFKKYQLRTHLFSVHIYENVEPTFRCPMEGCDKAYVNDARLKHHIKYTHLETKLICEYCTKTFSRRDALEEHTKIHTRKPEDRFRCEICGHFIADIKTFKKHVKNHATEGLDNTCHYCGKKSPNLNALKRHVKYVHETAPTHQCKYCDKSFKRPKDLRDHEAAIHTHQDLYECGFCTKTFRCHSNMLSHRKRDHPDQYKKPAYMRDDV